MRIRVKVGKRFAIYLPKKVVERMGIKEGDVLILRISEGKIELKKVFDPIELAIKGEKFASISPEEIEEVSINEQRKKVQSVA